MSQLIVLPITEVDGVEKSESIMFNTASIVEDTIVASGDGSDFYVGATKYTTTTPPTVIKAFSQNYDGDVVIPLQVLYINEGLVNNEVRVNVNDIVIGYDKGVERLIVIRNRGFLQSWRVSDTLVAVALLSNDFTVSEGDAELNNLLVKEVLTVEGGIESNGPISSSGPIHTTVNTITEGTTTTGNLIVEVDAVIGGTQQVAGKADFFGDTETAGTATFKGNAVVEGAVSTPAINSTAVLAIGADATEIPVGTVGFISDSTKRAMFIFPGEETLVEGVDQAVGLMGLTYLNAGDTGTSTGVLPNGTVKGQVKKIWMTSTGGGTWEVTFSTIYKVTFTTQGEYITLLWDGTIWQRIDSGLCNGAPVVGVV